MFPQVDPVIARLERARQRWWRCSVVSSLVLAGAFALAVFAVFLFLQLTEIFLAIGNFSSSAGLSQVGGYLGLITALVAWYTSAAGVSAGIGGKIQLPVGKPLIS